MPHPKNHNHTATYLEDNTQATDVLSDATSNPCTPETMGSTVTNGCFPDAQIFDVVAQRAKQPCTQRGSIVAKFREL